MHDELFRRMQTNKPRKLPLPLPGAGILVPVTDSSRPSVVLTLRSSHLATHGGQVAFPGGKRDRSDRNLLHTALREADEEIGLPADRVRVLGRLNQVVSRHGILVTPFAGLVSEDEIFTPNPGELHSVFKVPIEFFLEDRRHRTDHFSFMGLGVHVPCYRWDDYDIWGLSAMVLVDFLNVAYGAAIDLSKPPK